MISSSSTILLQTARLHISRCQADLPHLLGPPSAAGTKHYHPDHHQQQPQFPLPPKQDHHLMLCTMQTVLPHRKCACTGGVLAYGAARFGRDVIPLADEIVCTIATLLAASGAQLVGQRAGSAYAAKLSTITFLLVLLGSKDTPSEFGQNTHLMLAFFYVPCVHQQCVEPSCCSKQGDIQHLCFGGLQWLSYSLVSRQARVCPGMQALGLSLLAAIGRQIICTVQPAPVMPDRFYIICKLAFAQLL